MYKVKDLEKYVSSGLVTKRKHPVLPLWVCNYTDEVAYKKLWDENLIQLRGLVVDENNNVVAKSFNKFFNWEENPNIEMIGKVRMYEKMDGFLSILFNYNNEWIWCSRSSFESEHIEHTRRLWNDFYKPVEYKLDKNKVYVFETVGPTFRIVNKYEKDDIVLLGVTEKYTGKEFDLEEFEDLHGYLRFVELHDAFNGVSEATIHQYKNLEYDNFEGFVFVDEKFNRFKLKLPEYLKLHYLFTGISKKRIWQMMKDKEDYNSLISSVPDEFHNWFKKQVFDIDHALVLLDIESDTIFDSVYDENDTRKEFAEKVKSLDVSADMKSLLFQIFDHKNIRDYRTAWEMIKPKGNTAFYQDLEGD